MSGAQSLTNGLWFLSGALYFLAALLGVLWVFVPKSWCRGLARACGLFAFAFHTAAISARWQEEGQVPFLGFGESFYFLLWAIVAAFLAIESFGHVRGLGIFISPLIALSYFFSAPFIDFQPGLARVQRDSLLAVHIILALLAYAFFVLSFLLGSMYLLQNRALKRKKLNRVFQALPSIELLERWNTGSAIISLPLLSLALGLGAFAAMRDPSASWGDWFADPMVVASLVLWAITALIAFLRYGTTVRGKKIADLTLIGFAVVVLSLFGARLVHHGRPGPGTGSEAHDGR